MGDKTLTELAERYRIDNKHAQRIYCLVSVVPLSPSSLTLPRQTISM